MTLLNDQEIGRRLMQGQADMLSKWSDVLTVRGKRAELTGALRIGEGKRLNADLKACGFTPTGPATVATNGELYHQAYVLPQYISGTARDEWAMTQASLDDLA